jgi:hypothetical protein
MEMGTNANMNKEQGILNTEGFEWTGVPWRAWSRMQISNTEYRISKFCEVRCAGRRSFLDVQEE